MAKQRKLCYTCHCRELDKLPDHDRYKAANWRTVPPSQCELCQEELARDLADLADAAEAGDG